MGFAMLAVFLALAAAVSFGGSDYVAGLAARRAGLVVSVTVMAEVVKAVLVVSIVPFVSSQLPSGPSLAWGAVAGVSGGIGEMTLYAGLRQAAFSVASSVSAVVAAAFSVLAGLLLGERPGALQFAGIALAVPAIVAVSVRGPGAEPTGSCGVGRGPDATARHTAGVLWGLIAGAGFGLSLTALNRAGSATDLWPLVVAELAALATVACTAAVIGEFRLPPAATRWLAVVSGILGTAGIFCFFLATHRGLLAITAVIYSLFPAVTIVLARILSRERLTVIRMIGLILAAASVALIAAGGAR
jgi:drug/metabolite transporter (DMT)-like permease